jgi:Rrf2 family protein
MQFTLQRKTELALRALRTLARTSTTMPGNELAGAITTSTTYLPQVMSPLVTAGWVRSGRGPNGGYTLQFPADDISMLALIEASEGSLPDDKCVLRNGPCGDEEPCALHHSWRRAQDALLRELARISVLEHTATGATA